MSEAASTKQAQATDMLPATVFSIIFVTIGLCCFVWQTLVSGEMFYKNKKPIIAIVLFQAALGIVTTIITLLTYIDSVSCEFRLLFSVVGVNLGDMSLQFVLLWKAYLGNNRSKIILCVGLVPIVGIAVLILLNMTIARSRTDAELGLCNTTYPIYIVITKAVIDCSSNAFLSACFILVIYKHYQVLGSSIHKTLLTEGLIYCFGVCFSNIVTGILLALTVLGGDSPILYTIDWYLASYLIIKQLNHRDTKSSLREEEEDDVESTFEQDSTSTQTMNMSGQDPVGKIVSVHHHSQNSRTSLNTITTTRKLWQKSNLQGDSIQSSQRDTYYHHSMDNSTLVSSIASSPYCSEKDEHTIHSIVSPISFYKPTLPVSLSPPPRDSANMAHSLKEINK